MATTEQTTFEKRLFKVARDLNVSTDRVVEFLEEEGYEDALTGTGFNASIVEEEAYLVLREEYADDAEAAARVRELRSEKEDGQKQRDEVATLEEEQEAEPVAEEDPSTTETDTPTDDEELETAESEEELPEPPAETEEVDAVEDEEAAEGVEAVPSDEEEDDVDKAEEEAEDAERIEEASEPEERVESAEEEESEEESLPEEDVEDEAPGPDEGEEVEEEPSDEADEEAAGRPIEESETQLIPPKQEAIDEDEVVSIEASDEEQEAADTLKASRYRLSGTQVVGKVDVEQFQRPKRKRKRKEKSSDRGRDKKKKKDKKSKKKDKKKKQKKKGKGRKGGSPDEEDVEQTIQETLQELEQGASRARQRRRRRRRERHEKERQRRREKKREQENVIELTEFVTTGELANLMGEPVGEVIDTLFDAGMMVSINQRLDREAIEFVVDEYEMEVEFVEEFAEDAIVVEDDDPEDLQPRAPVVTVMGHVDHGKTSLLDYIRNANVVAGEEGGITQHIGAHYVELTDHEDEAITFLDTPGHEAFTAMRARGAKATDIVILVVAADDSVMPQTIEAINHAQAADVPVVVAVNKMDKREADAERVRAELAEHNVLVEEYGGDVQAAEVSAETGEGIDDLLEKVVLQAEIMELEANPDREASGVIIESRLEKGRGNVITVLVQNGTLEIDDPFLAGRHSGSVRAMFDERDNRIRSVGPSQPALVLGCDGSPEVGDQFVVMEDEGEARDLAQERQRIHREQELRRQSQVSLDQVSRKMAEGEFHELNLIVKADVGGSVEALSDALLKLKTDEVAVNIIHSGVGAITESDVMLARASDAIILGFQVRPTSGARGTANQEDVDIRTYSVIYAAIEDVRDALEGLLSPERREETKGRAEVRDTFGVPNFGTVAGCYVTDGTVNRNHSVRVVRDGVVIYDGDINSLKRFEDDVKEVKSGYECGLSVENFDDVKVDDELETYVVVEEKRELEV